MVIKLKLGRITKPVVVFAVALSVMLSATFIKSDEVMLSPYTDVTGEDWYYDAVSDLYAVGAIPHGTTLFYGDAPASRKDIVLYLYNLHKAVKGDDFRVSDVPFSDVDKSGEHYEAICWAYHSGIVKGYSDLTFGPEGQCSREELCTIAMRYLTYAGIRPRITGNKDPFGDSLFVSDFARSYIVSAKLAGIIRGNELGYLRPQEPITRGELAQILYAMHGIGMDPCPEGEECVDTTDGAYTPCYIEYEELFYRLTHKAYVEKSDAVDLSYFDDAVFVGDSVSMSLQYYCAASKALGNATFLCAGSLSPKNAHWPTTHPESKHPVYKGEKLLIEDAVQKSGAKKVYIMLGINSLAFGFDECVNEMVSLVDKIEEKSPDAHIIIQSVTPMTKTSPIKTSKLNNEVIAQYNEKLLDIAGKRGWYYVDVAKAVSDEENYLRDDYCSDPKSMGIHFNFEADKAWIEYLKTHVPEFK